MHDIDAQISRISGQQNYMESLQQITGNIMTVDMTIYKEHHRKIKACDFNINVLLKRLSAKEPENQTIKSLQEQYYNQSTTLNIADGVFIMHTKKSKKSPNPPKTKEIIAPGHLPSELIKTEWFKTVKRIEKTVNKFFNTIYTADVKPSDRQWVKIEEDYKTHPELLDIRTCYDCKLDTEEVFKSFQQLQKCAIVIINNLLIPMYNVHDTIIKHWDKIARVFKNKAFQSLDRMSVANGGGGIGMDDIVLMLEQFIIAKYRATVTGNNKHYVRLFLNVLGNDSVSNIDGARFMEIMDSIDLEKLDKNENVYKFAMAAKSAMSKIVNQENINAEEMIDEMNHIFDVSNECENEQQTEETMNAEESKKYDDLL